MCVCKTLKQSRNVHLYSANFNLNAYITPENLGGSLSWNAQPKLLTYLTVLVTKYRTKTLLCCLIIAIICSNSNISSCWGVSQVLFLWQKIKNSSGKLVKVNSMSVNKYNLDTRNGAKTGGYKMNVLMRHSQWHQTHPSYLKFGGLTQHVTEMHTLPAPTRTGSGSSLPSFCLSGHLEMPQASWCLEVEQIILIKRWQQLGRNI